MFIKYQQISRTINKMSQKVGNRMERKRYDQYANISIIYITILKGTFFSRDTWGNWPGQLQREWPLAIPPLTF